MEGFCISSGLTEGGGVEVAMEVVSTEGGVNRGWWRPTKPVRLAFKGGGGGRGGWWRQTGGGSINGKWCVWKGGGQIWRMVGNKTPPPHIHALAGCCQTDGGGGQKKKLLHLAIERGRGVVVVAKRAPLSRV